ncbi:MAG: SulP family inorganic anion transporter [Acidobacteria bacterium]|nr:SulP family inorganic anion transporter [Acidobacteriota bacterium]
MNDWLPKLILCLRNYDKHTFFQDLIAGFTVGLVALPLCMAFAISSGAKPEAGLYCGVVTGFLISALGGSKTQIGGPTGAFVVVVAGIISQYGLDGLFMCTMMAGVNLVILGATGMGTAVKFFPRPVVLGFTNGIALLIASTQIKDFFGLQIEKVPADFTHRLESIISNFSTFSSSATTLSLVALAVIILMNRFLPRVPGSIIALFGGTAVVFALGLNVETIGSRFGGIPTGLPSFHIPQFRMDLIPVLILPAMTVTMLGGIESLMSAVVADRMSKDKHNPNVELIAQGIANIASPLFGGLPATGAIARTATNIRAGAQTPVAGIIHALTLLAVLLYAAPLAKFIPLCVLSAILMVVAYNMGEWREITPMLKLTKADISVWGITFGLTVFADLSVAVEVGMILAALLFIRKVSLTTTVSQVTDDYVEDGRIHILQDKEIPDYCTVFRIHGPFLFGATDKISEITDNLEKLPPIVVLRLRNMTAIDATGLVALEDLADKLHATNRVMLICGAREQPAQLMHQAEFEQHIGRDNICGNIQEALQRAHQLYRLFFEDVRRDRRKREQPLQ